MFSVPPRGCLQWKQASFLKASTGPPNKEVATLEKEERLPETMVVECISGGGGYHWNQRQLLGISFHLGAEFNSTPQNFCEVAPLS